MIRVSGLHKKYKKKQGECRALSDVSFEIPAGSMVGLIGNNGAGKTTLIKCLSGLITHDSGVIRIEGMEMPASRRALGPRISVLSEGNRNMYWRLTVRENIRFFLIHRGTSLREHAEYTEHLLKVFDLTQASDTQVRLLSRGMQQKVSAIIALASNPRIAFLDEPTLGLDYSSWAGLKDALRRVERSKDSITVISSHDFRFIEQTCSSVMHLDEGMLMYWGSIEGFTRRGDITDYRILLRLNGGDPIPRELVTYLKEIDGEILEFGLSRYRLNEFLALAVKHEILEIEKIENTIQAAISR